MRNAPRPTVVFRSCWDLAAPTLLKKQRHWRCVLSDSRSSGPNPPAKDVLALFDKAHIGNMRYLTFAAPKAPEKSEGTRTPVVVTEAPAPMPAAEGNHLRRALHSVFEVNSRLRIDSFRPRLSAGASLAFASCAGGVGKTTLCATVARMLSSRLSNVLVADRCTDGIIPYFFSLERLSAGGLQTVYPNARRAGYQMTLVVAPCDEQPNPSTAAWLEQLQAESVLTLLDLPTFHGRSTHGALDRGGQIVIPLVPDVQSLASIAGVEELCSTAEGGQNGRSLFVLNRFDDARPLHREIRTHLERLLEDRLAPVALRESEYVPEALSLGMTVLDHVPQSPVVKDFEQLVGWLEARLSSAAEVSAEKVEIA
jgi:cellulose biosynthesis protein BcsQ